MSHNSAITDYFTACSEAEGKEWRKGEYLCREDGELKRLHMVVSGRFRVFRTLNNAREMLYRIYLPGSLIGDIEVFSGDDAASCSVQCIEHAVTLSVPMKQIRNKPSESFELIFALGRGLARKLHENSISEAVNTAYPLEVRLAHYYLSFADPELRAGTLSQLAGWMGCSYRHLTRSLADLKKKGAVRQTEPPGRGYEAADTAVLESIARPMLHEERGRVLFEPSG